MGECAHKFSKPGKILENYLFAPLVYKIQQVDELEVIVKSMVGFGHLNRLTGSSCFTTPASSADERSVSSISVSQHDCSCTRQVRFAALELALAE